MNIIVNTLGREFKNVETYYFSIYELEKNSI